MFSLWSALLGLVANPGQLVTYELLANSCLGVVVRDPDQPSRAPEFLPPSAVRPIGFEPDEMPGGHLVALARPLELVERLEAYRRK